MTHKIRNDRGGRSHRKSRCQKEEEAEDDNGFFATEKAAQPQMVSMLRSWKRRRHRDRCASKPLLYQNRQILSRLLDRITKAHNWKEASGVLSLLLKGTPEGSSLLEDRRNFLVNCIKLTNSYLLPASFLMLSVRWQFAMEIQRRFAGAESHYQTKIKKMYDVWMNKLQWMKKHPLKSLLQDPESTNEPTFNLLHGLILYQMWYSGLPEDMKIKGCDVHIPSQISDTTITNSYEEPDAFVSSNEHNAINIEDGNGSSIVASESSVCVEKNILDFKETAKQKNNGALHATELSSLSDLNDVSPSNPQRNYSSCSIFFSHGLEKSLLPLQFDHLNEDIEHVIHLHRGLVNEQYNDAVKHLRLALHSTPPLSAALLPLVQLHLLGDRVEEALKELDGCCQNSNFSLPFRLKGRILECFQSNQVATICTCYEDALRRDRTCNQSLQRLIKMHRIGNYDTIPLLEMIVLNLDATDGESSTWEEFALCFLKILTSAAGDFEDRISINGQRVSAALMSDKIPRVYTEGQERATWKVRCRWWRARHFSKNAYLKEMQHGDWKLLASKAACASHLYGPHFEYIEAVHRSLTEVEDASSLSFLQTHLENSTRLEENLA